MALNMSNIVEQDLDVILAGVGVSRFVGGLDNLCRATADMMQCDETHPICERKTSMTDQWPSANGCYSRMQKGWTRMCISGENNACEAERQ